MRFAHLQLFMILKKNNSHLTFLHCYHHFFMALGLNFATRWIPGGHGTLLGVINCFVHAVMYSYFFLTAFNPDLKKSIWWKKHITQIQMVSIVDRLSQKMIFPLSLQAQFAILLVHFVRGALQAYCGYPKFWLWLLAIQNGFMLILFADFYHKAYIRRYSIAAKKTE